VDRVYFVNNLHAKLYLNEQNVILSSMNFITPIVRCVCLVIKYGTSMKMPIMRRIFATRAVRNLRRVLICRFVRGVIGREGEWAKIISY
jgi:hypothetical protein